MNSNRSPLILWTVLAAVFLMALISIVQKGPQYIGKSFVETEDFKSSMNNFYENIGPTVLNPVNLEEAEKRFW